MTTANMKVNPCEFCGDGVHLVRRYFGPVGPKPTTRDEGIRNMAHNMWCLLAENCEHAPNGFHLRLDISPVLYGEGCKCSDKQIPVRDTMGVAERCLAEQARTRVAGSTYWSAREQKCLTHKNK